MKTFLYSHWMLVTILIVAFLLRIVQIQSIPNGMYGDELTAVYDGYSILKTGRDQLGNVLPLNFQMGGGRPVGYVYFSLPFIALLGPTTVAIRLLAVLSGVGLVGLMYLLGNKFLNRRVGIFAATLSAFSFWSINISRAGFETTFALFLSVLGVVLILYRQKSSWYLPLAAFSFAVAMHTYATYKMEAPLLVLLLLIFNPLKQLWLENRKGVLLSIVIMSMSFGLLIAQATFLNSETRFLTINIFNNQKIADQITQTVVYERNLASLPVPFNQLFHNKVFEYFSVIIANYLSNFSFDFLFLHGDHNPRHNMTEMGELYYLEGLLILAGLYFLFKTAKRVFWFMVLWVLLGPLATTLVGEPHALRNSMMLAPLLFIAASGFYYLSKFLPRMIVGLMIAGYLLQFVFYAERYYVLSPIKFGHFWSLPAKVVAEEIISQRNEYDFVIVNDKIDNIEYAYPVYAQIAPTLVLEQNKKRSGLEGINLKKLDNVYIGDVPTDKVEQLMKSLPGKVLFIGLPEQSYSLPDTQLKNIHNVPAYIVKEKK